MKIQLKRSNVLDGGAAKEPTAAQMEYGELAVNYNNGDPAIFLKDNLDNIVRIAGGDAVGNEGYPDLDDGNGATLDDRYVNITGDDMTGKLTVGAELTLTANNGKVACKSLEATTSITGSSVRANSELYCGTGNGSGGSPDPGFRARSIGLANIVRGYGGNPCLQIFATNDNDPLIALRADGSAIFGQSKAKITNTGGAEFQDVVKVGTTGSFTSSSPAISLNPDGTAAYASDVTVGSTSTGITLKPDCTFLGNSDINIITRQSNTISLGIQPATGGATRSWGGFIQLTGRDRDQDTPGTDNKSVIIDGGRSTTNKSDGNIWFYTGTAGNTGTPKALIEGSSGNLLIGGTLPSAPEIKLNNDGTSFFTGQVNVGGTSSAPNLQLFDNGGFISGGNPTSGNSDGVRANASGSLSVSSTSNSSRLWNGFKTGVGLTSQIRADGNITSLGRFTLGGNYNGSSQENVQITLQGSDGSGTMTGTLTQNASDIKFKDNIADAPYQSADIKALQLRTWDWNDSAPGTETRKARHTMGLVAQEAALVDADITYTANESAEDTDTQFQAIDHDVLTMKLVGALQEALTEIDDLKARIEALEA